MSGAEKTDGWNPLLAGVYGEDGADPEALDAGENTPPEDDDVADIGGGNIERKKWDD